MLLIAKNELGIIKPGMRFSFIRESGDFVETYCIELDMNFKLSKLIIAENFDFYYCFGLFRLAVIAQQIYYRYDHKQTNNPAFKNFWIFIHYLMWRCNKAIKASGKR